MWCGRGIIKRTTLAREKPQIRTVRVTQTTLVARTLCVSTLNGLQEFGYWNCIRKLRRDEIYYFLQFQFPKLLKVQEIVSKKFIGITKDWLKYSKFLVTKQPTNKLSQGNPLLIRAIKTPQFIPYTNRKKNSQNIHN